MKEQERFISLFDQQIRHTFAYLERIPQNLWRGVPADAKTLSLGDRVNKITISALARHLLNAERHWITQLPILAAGATLTLPGKGDWLDSIGDGQAFIESYRANHSENLTRLAALSDDDVTKLLTFNGRRYTAIGFLWSLLGHHAYHLGQIDLLMRQQGVEPPEYMDWPETEKVLG